jgi:quinol-cytochrome oxidoreductase complex cytochrome b subunit
MDRVSSSTVETPLLHVEFPLFIVPRWRLLLFYTIIERMSNTLKQKMSKVKSTT